MKSDENTARLVESVGTIYSLQEKYSLVSDSFKKDVEKINDFRVTAPIVGKFSTGKSSLLNSLIGKNRLGKSYLPTALTPETSVPTEIFFGTSEKILVFDKNSSVAELSLEDYSNKRFRADEISKVQLVLDNEFLKSIPNVKIVDMPGFDSGVALHNKAIDDYLPDSQAYILTFAATEPVIPDSIANFLRELKLYRLPVYIVITKSGTVTNSRLKECIENIRRNAADYLGLNSVEICCTNSKGKNIDVGAFADVLRKIEGDSQKIFAAELTALIQIEANRLDKYLRSVIRQTELTPSELETKKEDCRHQLKILKGNLERAKRDFSNQVAACINSIQARVSKSLYSAAPSLEIALMNNSDINSKINSVVRETIISSIQAEFEPKFRRYVEKMTEQINLNVRADFEFKLDKKNFALETAVKSVISHTVKKAVPAILGAFGLAVSGPLAALIGVATSIFLSSKIEESRRNEQLVQVRRKVHGEIIPQIIEQVGESLRQNIYAQIESVNARLEEEAEKIIDDQEKALAELTKNLELETAAKQNKLNDMIADLNAISKFI